MTNETIATIQQCTALSSTGQIAFGEVVARLIAVGVERYHADYCRMEKTYYLPDGDSYVVPMNLEAMPIAESFATDDVQAAIRQAQRGEIMYPQFVRQTIAGGCVGYFVQIAGKCALYFGRRGEVHTEWFPGAR